MRPVRPLFAAALTAAAFASAPSLAAAAPPVNDNYLSSLPVDQVEFTGTADTTEATTQTDLFNPNRDGQPLGGGAAEPLDCKGTPFGKTVWYDLAPQVNGGLQLRASGFQTVVAVYEWNPQDSRITRLVDCSANAGVDDLLLNVVGKKNYTIQVGGVGGAGGPLTFKADFFPDQDGDGILDDQPDKCKTVPGIERFGGCPPDLKVNPSIGFGNTGTGIVINKLNVDRVPKGAKVVVTCGSGCGSQTVKAKRFGRVVMSKLIGKNVRAGRKVEVRVTLGKTGTGTYKYGATGSYFAWPVKVGGIGSRIARCLNVKTSKIEKCT
jgi:hypothetical protein